MIATLIAGMCGAFIAGWFLSKCANRKDDLAGTWRDGINEVTHKYWRGHKAIHMHGVTGVIKAVENVRGQPHVLVVRDDNGKEERWPAWVVRDEEELELAAHKLEHR